MHVSITQVHIKVLIFVHWASHRTSWIWLSTQAHASAYASAPRKRQENFFSIEYSMRLLRASSLLSSLYKKTFQNHQPYNESEIIPHREKNVLLSITIYGGSSSMEPAQRLCDDMSWPCAMDTYTWIGRCVYGKT